jgi:hypothetical protein
LWEKIETCVVLLGTIQVMSDYTSWALRGLSLLSLHEPSTLPWLIPAFFVPLLFTYRVINHIRHIISKPVLVVEANERVPVGKKKSKYRRLSASRDGQLHQRVRERDGQVLNIQVHVELSQAVRPRGSVLGLILDAALAAAVFDQMWGMYLMRSWDAEYAV